jgi:hypothetical protein
LLNLLAGEHQVDGQAAPIADVERLLAGVRLAEVGVYELPEDFEIMLKPRVVNHRIVCHQSNRVVEHHNLFLPRHPAPLLWRGRLDHRASDTLQLHFLRDASERNRVLICTDLAAAEPLVDPLPVTGHRDSGARQQRSVFYVC